MWTDESSPNPQNHTQPHEVSKPCSNPGSPRKSGESPETRTILTAISLVSRVFLHYLHKLAKLPLPEFPQLWHSILSAMREAVLLTGSEATGSRKRVGLSDHEADMMREAVEQTLKNNILVLHAMNIMSVPGVDSDTDQASIPGLWEVTIEVVDSFLPHLRSQIFPGSSPLIEENSMGDVNQEHEDCSVVTCKETSQSTDESFTA